ncbi:MAG TPA: GAF domain-containing protein, partial [Patescibacteria group bacterium]|nr:GAF domain-containing protein [Patescibacteria group bacterium]
MFKNISTLLCLNQNKNYDSFLDILTYNIDNLVEIRDISSFEKNIKEYSSELICLVFLDYGYLSNLSEEICTKLSLPNFICIILVENNSTNIFNEPYVYDILSYEHPSTIKHLLLRLKRDLKYRLNYYFLQKKHRKFHDISVRLTTEKDINHLLDLIIDSSMELAFAEAGSIYIVEDKSTEEWSYYENHSENKCLRFVLAKNKALPINLEKTVVPISKSSIYGCTVITGKSIRIDDVYHMPEDAPYQFNSLFDQATGYKTKSMLNVPMTDHYGHILGVIQLINKKNEQGNIPFDDTDELMTSSLAGLAAVAIENAILYKMNEKLLESKTQKLKSTVEELNHAQIQLIQKEKMAAVGQLAAGVAHEINNPLGFVISNHDTLQKYMKKLISLVDQYKDFSKKSSNVNDLSCILEFEAKNKIDFVKTDIFELHKDSSDGLNRIGSIVNALRAFSHIDQIDDFQEFDINQCIQDTLTICNSRIKYANIDIEKQ